nr:replication factor C subunit 3-like [Ipomoea batatas]
MSSPSIPRCKSVPSIPDAAKHSPSSSDTHAASVKTSKSAESIASAWQKITKKKWKPSSSSSKNSNLTVENLKEFDRRNEVREGKREPSSPYYRGLTDQKIGIEKQKLAESSPLRESFSVAVSSRSFVKIQERRNSRTDLYTLFSKEKPMREKISETTQSQSTKTRKEQGKKQEIHHSSRTGLNASTGKEKSLRERVSEQLPPPIIAPSLPQQLPEPRLSLPSPPPTPLVQAPEQEKESSPPPTQGKSIAELDETVAEENEFKFIWADKHRPQALKDFLCNRDMALKLQALAKNHCDKHFIFEGPPGVGKRTMIFALLREVFGPDKVQDREECQVLSLKGESVPSIQVNVKVSMRHIEINLSETKGYEQHVIVELIRGKSKKLSGIPFPRDQADYKAIIICEAEKLSTDSLLYIKWILEKYKGSYKVFFCCSDASKLQPIKSTCKVVQLCSPSNEEIINVLEFIAEQEGVELPHPLAEKFANSAKRNLRQAIRSFEATWHHNSLLKEDQEIMNGWEDDIAKIARNIIEEQSPRQLYEIRRKLQNLIEHNVSAEFIFYTLGEELKKNLDKELQNDIDNLQQKYKSQLNGEESGNIHNDPLRQTVQQFMKIEEFIAKFMSWYKTNVVKKGKR